MARLQLTGITKRYGEFKAADDISLDIADGEFLVLLGPSGCGKTTTLRIVAGFIEPTSGSVRLGDRDITSLPPWKRNTGLVFQSYALFPHMTVAENIAFGLEMRQMPKAEMAPKITEALRLVRLDHLSSSAWRWRERWCSGPTCCCLMSRCPISMPSCARTYALKSANCNASSV
jgi:putative spermidine/putrescine transport system ATP-binding protein